ncbi:MAG: glycosyltransferase family 2 protein [Paludibacteraceae bacterium]|nr:glycosyltransferase family 2 protein [Paludibacteraceae bacterium]
MKPTISVIIPCYNQAAYLPKAITSLQAQTMPDWECIIVDDGSTDNSAEIAANIALKDERVRLLQKQNGGSASARNMGLQVAQGEYIQFLDADDSIDSCKFEEQLTQMEDEQLDMSYCAYKYLFENGTLSRMRFAHLNKCTILTGWGLGYSIPPHSFLYKASFLHRNNIEFDSRCRYREDWNFLIRCFQAQPRINTLPNYCGAYYFQNQTGKTSSYVKMQEGNFAFMAYMSPLLHGWNKCMWAYRISEELWIWLLRMMKYRSTAIAKSLFTLPITTIIIAALLMPISILGLLRYLITTYIAK